MAAAQTTATQTAFRMVPSLTGPRRPTRPNKPCIAIHLEEVNIIEQDSGLWQVSETAARVQGGASNSPWLEPISRSPQSERIIVIRNDRVRSNAPDHDTTPACLRK